MKKSRFVVTLLLLGLVAFFIYVRSVSSAAAEQTYTRNKPTSSVIEYVPSLTDTPFTTATPSLTTSVTPTLTPNATVTPLPTRTARPTAVPSVAEGLASLKMAVRTDIELKAAVCAPDWDITPREGEVIVPILLYHFVGRDTLEQDGQSTTRYDVTLPDFRMQLALFQQLGYHTVTISEVTAALRGEIELPERPIAITVDDGWVEQYTHIFATLQEFEMRATFYIPSSYPVGGRLVTWEQLDEMIDAGMEIGSHTRDHVDLTELEDTDELRNQVLNSKLMLEDKLDITVESISYPFGNYNTEVVNAIRDAGYSAAVALGPSLRQRASGIYVLTRIEVLGTRPLLDLVQRLPWLGQDTDLCLEPNEPDVLQ